MRRIGIDVGGTHTDMVLMDGEKIIKTIKYKTSIQVSESIQSGIKRLLFESQENAHNIQAVMLGTTHFTNAVVEKKELNPVAIIRLGLPATQLVAPLTDWPSSIKTIIHGGTFLCHGGIELTNQAISLLKKEEIERIIDFIQEKKIESVAISSVFSPLNDEHELAVAQLIKEKLPHCHLSLSSRIGRLGLLQRENATILNASLRVLAKKMLDTLKKSLQHIGISAPLFISQNDGTLISETEAKFYPVKTFASGPTNSLRGAAYLCQLSQAVIADIGGTTTDIGLIQQGFPVEAPLETRIAGIRINFRMPHLLSIGIGGGSKINPMTAQVGPKSVGYQLQKKAFIFGGPILTASDLAVAAGWMNLGKHHYIKHIDPAFISKGLQFIQTAICKSIKTLIKIDGQQCLVLVGGAHQLLGTHLTGFKQVIRPKYAEIANAIGAAIGQVSSEVNKVVDFSKTPRAKYLKEMKKKVIDHAIKQGAAINTVKIVDIEEVPLTYFPGNSFKLKIKAVGNLVAIKNQTSLHG